MELSLQHIRKRKLYPEAHTRKAFLSGALMSSFVGSLKENALSLEVRGQASEAVRTNQYELVEEPDDICKVCLSFPCPLVAVSKRELRKKVFQAVADDRRFPNINERRQRGLTGAAYEFLKLIDNHWKRISSERSGIVPSTTNR